ncbi:MAG: 4a-hydroxytetrahydrobiopterin dehydratase [Pseudomonadota bacterium]
MNQQDLTKQICKKCSKDTPKMSPSLIQQNIKNLDPDWQLIDGQTAIMRTLHFKGYKKGVKLANICAQLCSEQGHHCDFSFGWGYCTIKLTTHAIHALSENDFIMARHFDHAILKHI